MAVAQPQERRPVGVHHQDVRVPDHDQERLRTCKRDIEPAHAGGPALHARVAVP